LPRPSRAARWSYPECGVNEKSLRKRHRYLIVVNALDRGRVLYVVEGRRQASLDSFWGTLTSEQFAGVKVVAMDTWGPYVASTRTCVDGADDKFHIKNHLAN